MRTLYPFQHEHTVILSLRFSLHVSFFLLLSRVEEGQKKDREREKEWWCILSLSLRIRSNAFTRTTSLSHSIFLLTNIFMHAIHTWLHECLFICAYWSVCYLLIPSLHTMFLPRFDFAFVHNQFTVGYRSDCMVVIPIVGNLWILIDTQEPVFWHKCRTTQMERVLFPHSKLGRIKRLCVRVRVYVCACVPTRVFECECVCLWVWNCVSVYECVCVCLCLCVCRRVHVRVWNRFYPRMHRNRPVLFVAQAKLTTL